MNVVIIGIAQTSLYNRPASQYHSVRVWSTTVLITTKAISVQVTGRYGVAKLHILVGAF